MLTSSLMNSHQVFSFVLLFIYFLIFFFFSSINAKQGVYHKATIAGYDDDDDERGSSFSYISVGCYFHGQQLFFFAREIYQRIWIKNSSTRVKGKDKGFSFYIVKCKFNLINLLAKKFISFASLFTHLTGKLFL